MLNYNGVEFIEVGTFAGSFGPKKINNRTMFLSPSKTKKPSLDAAKS